ncbi:MAG: hypothetical protein HEQ21_04950 [Blastomonas sp.]|jgi:hypothetical protein|uniref:hypothetical protein n=1 Tax=Blastomonas TaxID=150203 RepID=UPI0006B961DD|nr:MULTISPECIES: hypothetical protein [Blastomonas]KPF75895.1 hypothetical protein IP68_05065 [Blastomonas sp. AAP25]MCO5792146.1 hypothetical protein [Blastomonas sp.]MDK2757474.1 hypothetical protein [Blastomonas fulva]
MAKLLLSYRFDQSYFDKELDRDDFGRLSIRFETENFTGSGGFWVQWQDVVRFGDDLVAYPINAESPIIAQWGYEMQKGDDLIIRIAVAPKNKTGDLLVSVVLADDHDQSQRLNGSFVTEYAAIESFRQDIARMMTDGAHEAVLHGQ